MKVEIIERGTDVLLASRDTCLGGFVCPRKNELIYAGGGTYVVREVKFFYYDAIGGNDDFVEVLVDAE